MPLPSTFLSQVFTRRFFAFAGNSLLIYDYLLTLWLEVAYIWGTPWTFVKTLFLFNRYGNLIGQTFIMLEETGHISHHSQAFCAAFELYCAVFAVFAGETIRFLVIMRACAILGFRRKVAMLAYALYIFCAATILAVSLYWLRNVQYLHFEYLDEIGVCFAPVSSNVWMLWFIPLFLDGFVLVIVCRSLHRVSKWCHEENPSRLTSLLARDALMFYIAALFNVLAFMACWSIFRLDPRNAIPTLITYPLLSISGQRLVLNLRRFRERQDPKRDLSREVQRQIAAIVDEWLDHPTNHPSDPGLELDEFGVEANDGAHDSDD